MNTVKVLALAREAGLAVTISSHDSLHKFAALIRQQMEAENVCICGYTYAQHTYDKNCDSHGVCPNRQGVFRNERQHELIQKLDAENAELRKDAIAIKWLEDNHTLHTSVEILYVVDGYEVTVMHEDGVTPISKTYHGDTLLSAIDQARSAND